MSIELNEIVFATNNLHKLEEIRQMMSGKLKILSLDDIGCTDELPETHDSLEGNAMEKALYLWEKYKVPCFADDTGLEVSVLNGEPGVYSARYAGEARNAEDNMNLLLEKMKSETNRKAQFRCVIALILSGNLKFYVDGIVEGEILTMRQGTAGFGYDPIFKPLGFDLSFAQMSAEQKNTVSHRGRAIEKLVKFLKAGNY